jgi:hypothetical protein
VAESENLGSGFAESVIVFDQENVLALCLHSSQWNLPASGTNEAGKSENKKRVRVAAVER